MTLNSLSDIIHARRSTFPAIYNGEMVDNEVIKQILLNANQAPSHKHTEPWRFHIITGEKRYALANFFQKTYKDYTSPEAFKELKYKKLGKNPILASHIIVLGMEVDPNSGLPEWEEIAAVSCAVQNIYLSITAANLGGYWSSPGLMIDNISQFIDIRENEKCLGFFYIGIPKHKINQDVKKGPVTDKTKWYV